MDSELDLGKWITYSSLLIVVFWSKYLDGFVLVKLRFGVQIITSYEVLLRVQAVILMALC